MTQAQQLKWTSLLTKRVFFDCDFSVVVFCDRYRYGPAAEAWRRDAGPWSGRIMGQIYL